MWLWRESIRVLRLDPILLRLDAAISVIEDFHGHFYDFLTLLRSAARRRGRAISSSAIMSIAARTPSRRCRTRSRSR
jgi:hypothetical protein